MIIYCDVKFINIFFDDKWIVKVFDFGFFKVGFVSEIGVGYVSIVVKGSIGYLDFEYYKWQ